MDQNELKAKELAEKLVNDLSPEQLAQIRSEFLARYEELIKTHQNALDELKSKETAIKQEIDQNRETERTLTIHSEKFELMERRNALRDELRALEFQTLNQTNIVRALAGQGDLFGFTDKKGTRHETIPDFKRIETSLISFNEDTILTDPLPPYIPVMNEEIFRTRGFVFDAIRLQKNEYLLATVGFSEKDTDKFKFVAVTLDQLVLINQYYFVKAKAILQKEADDRTARQEASYDRLPRERREKHFAQKNFYASIPAAVKKKVAAEAWEALTLEEKEAFYKPHKKYGSKRLQSKLEETEMWLSFHEMYERFINPEALPKNKSGQTIAAGENRIGAYGNAEVFAYWRWFRDMMKWKIIDIQVQREANSETRKIALETSFGESNTSDDLKDEYGILVKRQNGSAISPADIEQIRQAWIQIGATFGNLKNVAAGDGLKISHTGDKFVFASKASGMYIPDMRTIAVTNKYGDEQFTGIFAHEVAHYIDNKLGVQKNGRYATDDFESSAGKVAFAFRDNMNEQSDSNYTNATKECFARALQQYFALLHYGDGAQVIQSKQKLGSLHKYILEDDYVSKDKFEEKVKPLVIKFLQENESFFSAPMFYQPEPVVPLEERKIPSTLPELDKLINDLEAAMKDMLDQNDPRAKKLNVLIGNVIDKRNDLLKNQITEIPITTKILFHGSNSDFDKFDIEKQGTGETGNLFGKGFYLTDSKDVALFYARQVAKKEFVKEYKPTGILGSDEPVYLPDADALAEKKVVIQQYKFEGKLINALDFIIDKDFENYIIDSAARHHGYGKEAAEIVGYSFNYLRSNRSSIKYFRGELEYIIEHVSMGDLAVKTDIVNYIKKLGYDGLEYKSDLKYEGNNGSHNYVIYHPETLTKIKETPVIKKEEKKMETATATGNAIALHRADIKKIYDGQLSLAEYKAAYARLLDSKEEIMAELNSKKKDDLLKMLGGMARYRYKNEKKDRVVHAVWTSLLDDFIYDGLQWNHNEKYEDVLARKIEKADEAYLEGYAKMIAEHRASSAADKAKREKAFSNPETLDEFRELIDWKGKDIIKTLSAEKQALYDELISEYTKKVKGKETERKAVVAAVEIGDTELKYFETKHTKTGADLFVVQLSDRVSKETYTDLNSKAKRLGGYYSSYNKGGAIPGFQFKEKSQAEKFMALKEGAVSNLDKVEERQENRKKETADKLRELAQKTIEGADEVINADRLTNTHRRATQAGHMEARARGEKRIGFTMQNIANAIESGAATHLDGIKAKTHIELLDSLIRRAHTVELREKYTSYADYEAHRDEPPTEATVNFLKDGIFPTIYRENIQRLINEVKDRAGLKLVAARWQKRLDAIKGGEEWFVPTSDDQMQELKDMVGSSREYNGTILKSTVDDYSRLKAMGIDNDSMLRAALREYLQYRGGVEAPDKVKQLERAIVGKKVGFDFFPTPKDLSAEMVSRSGLEPGMSALEPSAGNGNIAEAIRDAGVEPDVLEISSQLRDILEAKGFNVIGHDFLQHDFGDQKYDRIIMNPPFSDSQDIVHVQFAYELLKPGGRIVAIMGEGAFFRSDRKAIDFQTWIEVHGTSEKLPENTFNDKSLLATTGANARLVVIDKANEQQNPVTMEKTENTDVAPVAEMETPSPVEEQKPAGPVIPEGAINANSVSRWNEVPVVWKNTSPVKPVKYINSPYDKALISLCKPFFGTDELRPHFSGVYFNDKGIIVTDAHKLIYLPYPNEKYNGIYNTGPMAVKLKAQAKNDLFDARYPDVFHVIPKPEDTQRFKISVYKLLQYTRVALQYANQYSHQFGLKFAENKFIGFNGEFLESVLEAILKLGHDYIYAFISGTNRGMVLSPDAEYAMGKSEIFLIMPVMLGGNYADGDGYGGAQDLDWNRELTCYFDFQDNEIHNADRTVADFQMNYGSYDVLSPAAIKILTAYKKMGAKTSIPILEKFAVRNNEIIAGTFETEVIIHNRDLVAGIYDMRDGAAEYDPFMNLDEYPVKKQDQITDFNLKFIISQEALEYYLEKAFEYTGTDELRPIMNGFLFDYVGGKMFLVATNAHVLFKADITKHIEVTDGQEDFQFVLSKQMILQFLEFAGSADLTIKANKLNTVIDCPSGSFTTRNIDGKYPQYNSVIRKVSTKKLTLNIKDLWNCVKGTEAVAFLKKKKEDRWEITRFYDKPSADPSRLDIFLGTWKEENKEIVLVEEIKICDVPFTFEIGEFQTAESVLLIMPIMHSVVNNFCFNFILFREILETCSSEEIAMEYTEFNRGYQIAGDSFLYARTVEGQKKQVQEDQESTQYLIPVSTGVIDLRSDKDAAQHKPKFDALTKEDHRKLAEAHKKVDHKYDASLMGYHSGMSHWHEGQGKEENSLDELREALELMKDAVTVMKGKQKKEVMEAIELMSAALDTE